MIYGSLDYLSGGFLYDRQLVEYLRRQGEEVEVIEVPWLSYGRGLWQNLSTALWGRLCNAAFDILLQDELIHPSVFWLNRRLRPFINYPLVSIVHLLRHTENRPAWQNRLYRAVEQRYLASMDGFICISHHTRNLVEGLVGAGRPVVVAYPAGNRFSCSRSPADLAARAANPGPLQLLFLGSLIPRKGLHLLLEALSAVPSSDWQLRVAGSLDVDPAYVRSIQGRIAQLGLGGQVKLLGPLQGDDLVNCLGLSQVMAVPSYIEGLALVYLEGMGLGLPPIATQAGAAGEIITHGVDGFLVAPGDIKALTGHIQQLIQDRDLLLQMSLAAQARFQAHPTWEESGAVIHGFLQSLAA